MDMNKPDPLEMQGHIDALRIALGRLIQFLPVKERGRYAKGLREDGEEFQTERIPQMAHPKYMKGFRDMLDELC